MTNRTDNTTLCMYYVRPDNHHSFGGSHQMSHYIMKCPASLYECRKQIAPNLCAK